MRKSLIRRQSVCISLLTVATVLLAAALLTPAPVSARGVSYESHRAVPAGFRSWRALFRVQHRLNHAGQTVVRVARANRHSGFASYVVDDRHRTLRLYWHGHRSPAEARTIRTIRKHGVRVVIRPARYSARQLAAKVRLVERDASLAGHAIVRIETRPNGSGIRVGLRTIPGIARNILLKAASIVAAVLSRVLPHLAAALRAGGVRTTIMRAAIPLASREADTPPFDGGSVILHSDYSEVCTSGFAANWPAVGKTYLITAAHCGNVGGSWITGDGHRLGVAEGQNRDYDAMFINTTPNGGSEGYFYDGSAIFSGGQYRKAVEGAMHVGVGSYVCVSGAMTGAVCNIKVTGTAEQCGVYEWGCANVIQAVSQSGDTVIRQGDSGGPVFVPTDDAGELAVGLISTTYGAASECLTPIAGEIGNFSNTVVCSTGLQFTDLLDAIAPYQGLRITTAS